MSRKIRSAEEIINSPQTAFPQTITVQLEDREVELTDRGLTKREYYAACAMQGMLANGAFSIQSEKSPVDIAEDAVSFADVLIEELEKLTPTPVKGTAW